MQDQFCSALACCKGMRSTSQNILFLLLNSILHPLLEFLDGREQVLMLGCSKHHFDKKDFCLSKQKEKKSSINFVLIRNKILWLIQPLY